MQRRNPRRTLGVLVSEFPEQSEESYDYANSEREQQDKAAGLSEIRFPCWRPSWPIFDFSVSNIGHQNRLGREQVCHALSWISDLRLRSPKQFSREPNQSVSVTDQPWIIAIAVKDESSRISRNFVPYFLNNLL
jgi:hypothetical protein